MELNETYTINDALNLVNKLDESKEITEINPANLTKAMKAFASVKNKKNFKEIIDKYVSLAERTTKDSDIKENPHGFLEYLCAVIDHSFTTVGYSAWKGEKLEPRITQLFFRELYRKNL